jgi:Uma2 family endonuclease
MSAIPEYPQRHPISAKEYLRMAEVGVFSTDMRLELMEGEIIEMAPIGSRHAAVVNALAAFFNRCSRDRVIVSVQNPLIAGERSAPQPDVALLKPNADRYFRAHPTAADALLVVEVSDTTLHFDLDTKIPLYACAGIAEAWLVDLDQRTLQVFRDPDSTGYRTSFTTSGDQEVTAYALPDSRIKVTALFPA